MRGMLVQVESPPSASMVALAHPAEHRICNPGNWVRGPGATRLLCGEVGHEASPAVLKTDILPGSAGSTPALSAPYKLAHQSCLVSFRKETSRACTPDAKGCPQSASVVCRGPLETAPLRVRPKTRQTPRSTRSAYILYACIHFVKHCLALLAFACICVPLLYFVNGTIALKVLCWQLFRDTLGGGIPFQVRSSIISGSFGA